MALDVRTQIATVERTVWSILRLGLGTRLPAVADIAALRAAPVLTVKDMAVRHVTSVNNLFEWAAVSSAADDGVNVIQPTTPPKPGQTNGRWLRVTNPSTFGPNDNAPLQRKATGYVPAVVLYQGEDDDKALTEVFGQTPAILIEWMGDDPKARSQYPGALYWNVHELQVMCISQCLRPSPWALLGSVISGEAAKDPGVHRLLGDVRYLLAGVKTGVDGIESIEIGRADIVSVSLAQRLFVATVQIFVRTSWTIPDEDLEPMAWQVDPKHPTTFEDDGAFDPLNYVASGYTVQQGAGLTRTPAPGSAFIGGTVLSSSPAAKTFTANRDTYRDLKPDGTFAYVEVLVGAAAPPRTAGWLRLGVTRTDGADIVLDKVLASYRVAWPYGSFSGP